MTLVPFQFPETYFKLGNSSLKLIQVNRTWSEANRTCKSDGAHLVSIRSSLTQAYAELQVFRTKRPVWIGLNSVQVLLEREEERITRLQSKGQVYPKMII